MERDFEQIDMLLARELLASQGDAILATDARGMIRFWNPGAVRIFGFTVEEAVGASLDLIVPERLRQRHWGGWKRVLATGETRYGAGDLLSVPATTRDGRQISVEFTIVMLHAPDRRLIGMAAVLRDVTARFQEMRRLKLRLAEIDRSRAAESGD